MYNYIASFFTEPVSSRATSETIESVSSRTEFTESWQNIDSALNDLGQKIAELDKTLYLPNTFEQIDQLNTAISEDVRAIIQKINCMRKMTVPDDQVADRNKKIVDASTALRRLTSCNLHNLQKYDQVDRLFQFDQVNTQSIQNIQSQILTDRETLLIMIDNANRVLDMPDEKMRPL
jgi:hypothetical protein